MVCMSNFFLFSLKKKKTCLLKLSLLLLNFNFRPLLLQIFYYCLLSFVVLLFARPVPPLSVRVNVPSHPSNETPPLIYVTSDI